ncbi:helix-hairpin-helix domain-containing protein [Evansella sp. AB-rgal1]|uniref:helix-hairpin-helix domain-containing protein n=1 Tax=Evansella sp. AB-rgal1 TaxID=3242696 RepID=UPI00359EC2E5
MLRKHKIKLSEIHTKSTEELANVLNTTILRAKQLKGLATFQQIPSIGEVMATRLVDVLGYHQLEQLAEKHWPDVFHQMEVAEGYWTDPCVEDQIMCIIHYANHPESEKQWFDFTEERKRYREKHGYPIDRPTTAWYE